MDLLLTPGEHVFRRDVADGTVQAQLFISRGRGAAARGVAEQRSAFDFPVPKVLEQPAAVSATQLAAPKVKPTAPRQTAGGKTREILAAMAEATVLSLISSGLVRVPLELERNYKPSQLEAGSRR
jgi:hypothetical protein